MGAQEWGFKNKVKKFAKNHIREQSANEDDEEVEEAQEWGLSSAEKFAKDHIREQSADEDDEELEENEELGDDEELEENEENREESISELRKKIGIEQDDQATGDELTDEAATGDDE